ncbi:MATE family efflux transporter, partial [Escherichia coli]|nr:MATE family efflux transporter [Escherichia coli]
QGPISRTLLLFALPTLGSNILQSLNGSINSIWVGRFLGEQALAATANANIIMFLMFSAVFGFGMAATILIGQSMGRRD